MNDNHKSVDTEEVGLSEEATETVAETPAGEPVESAAEGDNTPGNREADEVAEGAAQELDKLSVDELKARLSAMETKADDHWARYLRTAAEMENVRKRAQRDVERAHKYGAEKFAADVLGVRDSIAMGLDAARDNATVEALIEGSEMTLKLLEQVLNRHGVTELDPMGEAFNPEQHEAMAMVDAPDAEPNSVVQVVQTGYEINGRLLRAARVMVAKA